jgi:hypothetical protein
MPSIHVKVHGAIGSHQHRLGQVIWREFWLPCLLSSAGEEVVTLVEFHGVRKSETGRELNGRYYDGFPSRSLSKIPPQPVRRLLLKELALD